MDTLENLVNIIKIKNVTPVSATFLRVIRREYDENFVSRLIAYCLISDLNILRNILNTYLPYEDLTNLCVDEVQCEKSMYTGRIDIFAKTKNPKIVLLIENKIFSWEHDDQTILYEKYAENHYKDYKKAYIYLKPNFNISVPSSGLFKIMSYLELYKILEKSKINDQIILDLLNHIREFFMSKISFSKDELFYLSNKNEIDNIIKQFNDTSSKIKNTMVQSIETRLKNEGIDFFIEKTDAEKSFRFYKKNWYREKEFYLYTEIYFRDDDLNRIESLIVLKGYNDYKKSESKFQNIFKHLECIENWYQYYTLELKHFIPNNLLENNIEEWQKELNLFAQNQIVKYVKMADEYFKVIENCFENE